MTPRRSILVLTAALLSAAPAARAAQIAYVLAKPEVAAVSTIRNASTFNSTQPVTREALAFDGLTAIRFGARWPNLRDGLNLQVAAHGGATGDCGIDDWQAAEVRVQCILGDRVRDFRNFLVLAVKPAPAETDRIAFAVLDRPSEASYVAEASRRFGSGSMQVTRSGVGRYAVSLGWVASTENTVQVTAVGSDARCNVSHWVGGVVHVRCHDLFGAPTDSQVSVLALSNRLPNLSFVWNNSTAGGLDGNWSHASDGGVQSVVRTGVGRYEVTLGPEADWGGHVQVTAYNSDAYCWVEGWGGGGGRRADVRCAREGLAADSRFTVMAVRLQRVVGNDTGLTLGAGTAAADAVLCPSSRVLGDPEFNGNGPEITVGASVGPSPDGRRLELSLTYVARELGGDESTAFGTRRITLFEEPGRTIGTVYTDASDTVVATDTGDPRMLRGVLPDAVVRRRGPGEAGGDGGGHRRGRHQHGLELLERYTPATHLAEHGEVSGELRVRLGGPSGPPASAAGCGRAGPGRR